LGEKELAARGETRAGRTSYAGKSLSETRKGLTSSHTITKMCRVTWKGEDEASLRDVGADVSAWSRLALDEQGSAVSELGTVRKRRWKTFELHNGLDPNDVRWLRTCGFISKLNRVKEARAIAAETAYKKLDSPGIDWAL